MAVAAFTSDESSASISIKKKLDRGLFLLLAELSLVKVLVSDAVNPNQESLNLSISGPSEVETSLANNTLYNQCLLRAWSHIQYSSMRK